MSLVQPTIKLKSNHVPGVAARLGAFSRFPLWTRKGQFARNVATLTLGTALGQGLGLALAPVITRLYSPADLGLLGLFMSFVSVATVATSLNYELGIVSAGSQKQAAQLTGSSIMLTVPVSIVCGVILYLLIHFHWLGYGALPRYSIPLTVSTLLLMGIFSNLRYWAVRQQQFHLIAKTTVLQQATRSVLQVVFGFLSGGPMGLIAGEMIGRGAGIGALFRNAWSDLKTAAVASRKRDVVEGFVEHRNLAIYSLPSSLIDTMAANILLPMLAQLYGPAMAGQFALTRRVLAVPLTLIATSVADTFHSRLAVCARETPDQILALFTRSTIGLLLLGIVPALVLLFAGDRLFAFAFGQRWRIAGTLAGISAPFFLAQMVVSPLSRLVFVLRGQRSKLLYDATLMAGILLVFGVASRNKLSLIETVWAITIVNVICYLIYYLVLLRIVLRTGVQRKMEASRI